MPITYLDEAPIQTIPTKRKITYLDEEPKESMGQMLLRNLGLAGKETYGAGKTIANVALLGLPEIASQRLRKEPFVTEELPTSEKIASQVMGFTVGAPAKIVSGVSKLATKVLPSTRILPSIAKGATIGATAGVTQLPSPEEASTLEKALRVIGNRAKIGGLIGGVIGGVGALKQNIFDKIKNYSQKKVLAIRQGAKQYHNQEVKAYGDMLDDLAKEGGEAMDVQPTLEKMTKMMIERRLYDPATGNWLRPLNRVDSQLVKSYETLLREFKQADRVDLGKVIKECQNIKNAGGAFGTSTKRIAGDTANEIIEAIKPQIKSGVFQAGNARYAEFKQNMEALNKYFDIWGAPKLTGKGEKFLMRRLGETGEAREIAKLATEKAGQTLKGAEIASRLRRLLQNPLVRYGALGGGGLYGLSRIIRGKEGYEE